MMCYFDGEFDREGRLVGEFCYFGRFLMSNLASSESFLGDFMSIVGRDTT